MSVRPLLSFFAEEKLRLVLSDKEGHFVVLSESLFAEKASAAVEKNFKKVPAKTANVKKNALQLLSSLELGAVAAVVKKAQGMQLDMFFVAKTHNNHVPFRAIVSDTRGSKWSPVLYKDSCLS